MKRNAVFILSFILFILLPGLISVAFAQKVQLTWDQSKSQNVFAYNIYKKSQGENHYQFVSTVSKTDTAFLDEEIDWDSHLFYAVTSVDQWNKESSYSKYVEVIVPALQYNLLSFDLMTDDKQVILQWSGEGTSCLEYFEVQRRQKDTDHFQPIDIVSVTDTVTAGQFQFIDEDVSPGSYHYRLKIVKLDGEYIFSHHLDVTIQQVSTFFINQNYPNPFNSSTTIRYGLKQAGEVKIEIYDVQGKKISTLTNQFHSAGKYHITWYGTDEQQNKLPSGLYWAKIKAFDEEKTKKMILLK